MLATMNTLRIQSVTCRRSGRVKERFSEERFIVVSIAS